MGNAQHLKRHVAPVAWPIKRKNITFIAKPNPGSHKLKYSTCVLILLRDVLKYGETAKEVKLIVHNKEVLVNGKKISDVKFPVGLFDVFEIKDTKERYTLLFDEVGKIKLVNTKDNTIYLKVSKKTITPGKKYQLNFMNGFNAFVDEKSFKSTKVNDTVVYDLDKKKSLSTINLKQGVYAYIFDGKFQGHFGLIKEFVSYNGLTKDVTHIEIDGVVHTTAKDYCFAIGTKKEDLKSFE